MSMLKIYLLGIVTFPTVRFVIAAYVIFFRAARDWLKLLRAETLRPGYGWWHWLYLAPLLFVEMYRQQVWSWWHGIETRVDPA